VILPAQKAGSSTSGALTLKNDKADHFTIMKKHIKSKKAQIMTVQGIPLEMIAFFVTRPPI
jgi:hypothetical protein